MLLLEGTHPNLFICAKPGWDDIRYAEGTLKAKHKRLTTLNNLGYDIFFVVNRLRRETGGGHYLPRKKENITSVRAIWQEDDNDWQGDFPTLPDYVVQTSPGHFHRYWLTTPDTKDFTYWEAVQAHMTTDWGSDPGAKDLTRVMRVPGFINHKRDGFEVTLLEDNFKDFHTLKHLAYEFKLHNGVELPTKVNGKKANASTYLGMLQSGEHLHTPVRGLMMMMANKGHDPDFTQAVLSGLIHTTYSGDDRDKLNKQLTDLPAMIRTTWDKVAQEDAPPDLNSLLNINKRSIEDIKFPPGLAGRIMEYVYKRMHHKSLGLAYAITIGFLASFLGRRFNISEAGLSVYLLVFANTGFGKDQVEKLVQELTRITCRTSSDVTKYFAASGFTSAKAITKQLLNNMCMVSIIDEFGKYLASQSGDSNSVLRFFLEAYSQNGKNSILKGKAFSDANENVSDLFAPSLSLIGLTNQDYSTNSLIQNAADGFIPRCSLVNLREQRRVWNDERIPSHEIEPFFTDAEVIRMLELRNFCAECVSNTPPVVVNVPRPPQFVEAMAKENEDYNRYIFEHKDPSMAGIVARQTMKVTRLAALVAIINQTGDISEVQIDAPTWDWAKEVIDIEISNFSHLQSEANSTTRSSARQICAKGLLNFFQDVRPSLDLEMKHFSVEHRQLLLFTLPILKRKVRGNSALQAIEEANKYSHQTAVEEVLRFWDKEDIVKDVTTKHNGKIKVQKQTKIYRFNAEALAQECNL